MCTLVIVYSHEKNNSIFKRIKEWQLFVNNCMLL